MSAEAAARLAALGLELPAPRQPSGLYRGSVQSGCLLFLSGQGSDGHRGRLGADLDVEAGRRAARQCALNLLSQVVLALGSLDRVRQVVRVHGFVTCTADFVDAPSVVDGASELLREVLGTRGEHARSAIGAHALPLGFAVEVEMICEVTA